jgi:hypothetical protein
MINPRIWLALPQEKRAEIAHKLGLTKSGNVEVTDNQVICDGYTVNDLMGITVEKLQEVLQSKEADFFKLWDELIRPKVQVAQLPPEEAQQFQKEFDERQSLKKKTYVKKTKTSK